MKCRFRGVPRNPPGKPTLSEYFAGMDFEPIYTEVYRLETLAYATEDEPPEMRQWRFWVHESLTTDQAYQRIIEGYELP